MDVIRPNSILADRYLSDACVNLNNNLANNSIDNLTNNYMDNLTFDKKFHGQFDEKHPATECKILELDLNLDKSPTCWLAKT